MHLWDTTAPLNPEQLREIVAGAEQVFTGANATTSPTVTVVPLVAALLAFFGLSQQARRK